MIDVTTQEPLRVLNGGTDWPYIMVPVSQLSELRQLLDRHKIRYSEDEYAISLDGGPETTIVDLGRGTDVSAVQSILNGAVDPREGK